MIRTTLPLALALALACAACSKPAAPTPATPPAPQVRVSTPWDSMEAQKKKAQDVQKTVDDQAKRQQQAVEAQEQ
jgi:ABC-type glycerol-3-phosphate transport system substrate-binding protein